MKYFEIEPNADPEFDNTTVFINRMVIPPEIEKLVVRFRFWSGSEILNLLGIYFVTNKFAEKVKDTEYTGISYDECEVIIDEQYKDGGDPNELPPFKWMKVHGQAYKDDFGISTDKYHLLVVSERAFLAISELDKSFADEMAGHNVKLAKKISDTGSP